MVVSPWPPMLKTSPIDFSVARRAKTASMASWMWPKVRDWEPSPWMVSGWFSLAAFTNLGSTMPYAPVWRGPTVLKKRSVVTGS